MNLAGRLALHDGECRGCGLEAKLDRDDLCAVCCAQVARMVDEPRPCTTPHCEEEADSDEEMCAGCRKWGKRALERLEAPRG